MPTVPTPHDHALPAETLAEKDARLTAAKTCIRCGEMKSETEFNLVSRGRRRGDCRECRNRERRARGERKGETTTERLTRRLREDYKLTREQFEALVAAQDGRCAICRTPPPAGRRLAVDHCHASGAVRALLCTYCNIAVGFYENHGRAAARYLATYGDGNPLLKP